MSRAADAIIVGAGPAGAAAAIVLARAGWSVALIERQRFPRRKVCGECIAASNLPLLQELGIGAQVRSEAGAELRRVLLLHGAYEVTADLPSSPWEGYRWGRALGRETLDAALLQQAAACGAQVLQPWNLAQTEGGPGAWRCRLRALESNVELQLRAPVLINASGSWQAGVLDDGSANSRRRHGADLLAFKANFEDARIAAGALPVLLLDGGYGGMVVAGRGVATVACCVRRDRLEGLRRAAPAMRVGDAVEAWLKRECAGVERALHGATRIGPWIGAGPIDPGVRLRSCDEPYRVGNAAGEVHPILGEGISMALQSAMLLCASLVEQGLSGSIGNAAWHRDTARRYSRRWRREFAGRMRLGTLFAHAAMRPASATMLMRAVHSWPQLLTFGARLGGKVRNAAALR